MSRKYKKKSKFTDEELRFLMFSYYFLFLGGLIFLTYKLIEYLWQLN